MSWRINMEAKNVTPQERKITPQERWQAKVGVISKAYKLKKDLVDEFTRACEKAGISQAKQISKMMKEFIDSVDESKN